MSRPQGIQRKRTKGWRNPPHTKYVGRPTKWGNPHIWRECPKDAGPPEWARGAAVELYEKDLKAGFLPFTLEDVVHELRGWNLSCFCPLGKPCHRDVLLRIANS